MTPSTAYTIYTIATSSKGATVKIPQFKNCSLLKPRDPKRQET